MALTSKSLMTYGIQVSTLNNLIDFQVSSSNSILTATLTLGFYSPGGLADEVALAMQTVDTNNVYTVSVARNILGGTQNRLIISTAGSYLSLLFASGPNASISSASIMGFNKADYTGAITYTGSSSMGTILMPTYFAYNYLDTNNMAKNFGAVNVSASGLKESVTFTTQYFIELEFMYESAARLPQWQAFFTWAIQQRQFDFTPQISDPSTVYNVTLDKTQYDGMGLGWKMNEMLPDFPNFYQTGPMTFRVILATSEFATGG